MWNGLSYILAQISTNVANVVGFLGLWERSQKWQTEIKEKVPHDLKSEEALQD